MPGAYATRTWQHDPTLDAPAKYRRACRYDAFMPQPLGALPVTLEATIAGVVQDAENAIRKLNALAQPALQPLGRLLLRTESIASSRIEGLQLDLRRLARAEASFERGERVGSVTAEVLANIGAMELAIEEATQAPAFRVRDIQSIHRRLMAGTTSASRIAGVIRTTQNWIGGNDYNPCGADFVPPPPEQVQDLLNDLCDAINDERLPPLVQAALVHAQFETIHPFADGNGRTGRALIHVVLRRREVAPAYVPPVSVVLGRDKARYIGGLTRFRGDGVETWIEQFAAATAQAAGLAASYMHRVRVLQNEWVGRLRSHQDAPRQDAAAWAILDVLPGYPIITGPLAQAATGRSRPQVYVALGQLERAGILRALSQSRRNRSWEAAGLLGILEGLEAGVLPPR